MRRIAWKWGLFVETAHRFGPFRRTGSRRAGIPSGASKQGAALPARPVGRERPRAGRAGERAPGCRPRFRRSRRRTERAPRRSRRGPAPCRTHTGTRPVAGASGVRTRSATCRGRSPRSSRPSTAARFQTAPEPTSLSEPHIALSFSGLPGDATRFDTTIGPAASTSMPQRRKL